jgi:hypothetical protein
VSLAFEIAWDPGLRGILATAAIVAALCGSVYLILATNMGSRLGFLVAVAGLSGWMAIMGFVWALYGIGYLGTAAHWEVEEVVTSESADDLSAARLEHAHDLSKWEELAADNPARGEAQATASAAMAGEESRVAAFEAESDFIAIDAYTYGGKDVSKNVSWSDPFGDEGFTGWLKGWLPGPHPPHYTIVQVQAVKEVEVPFGETPPPAEADEDAPVQSVIMVRDLGKKRVPAVLISLSSLIVFGVTCNVLHRRDKALMAARAAAGV